MANELKPYELANIYRESRHSRTNSWLFSLLALKLAIAGFGVALSDLPNRYQTAIGIWFCSAGAALQAKTATRQAEKYQRRRDTLEWASEEAQLSAIVKSVQTSLPAVQLKAELERPLLLPSGASPLESFAGVVQQLLASDLELRTDYVDAIAGSQLIQLQLRPHDLKRVKQLQGEAMAESIQTLLSLPEAPILSLEKGAIALSIPRPDRQFCHFTDYVSDAPPGALRMAIGVNIRGELIEAQLSGESLQHFVVGGAPRQGKSQWILSAMGSLTRRYTPKQIQFIGGDGKGGVTLGFLQGSPYLLQPIAYTREAATDLVGYLKGLVDGRYSKFRRVDAQTVDAYNATASEPLPYVGVFLDEFQDLFTLDPRHDELAALESLASLAPAAGVFFVWSSQRIDGKLLPPQINSKCLSRVCLKVQKDKDSEFVLNGDTSGVNLLGKGDLIYDDGREVQRLQSLYIPHRDAVFGKQSALPAPGATAPTLEQFSQEFSAPTPIELLEKSFNLPTAKEHEPVYQFANDALKNLASYLQRKGEISVRDIKYSWGSNHNFNAQEVQDLLIELMHLKLIETYTPDGTRAEWVRWTG